MVCWSASTTGASADWRHAWQAALSSEARLLAATATAKPAASPPPPHTPLPQHSNEEHAELEGRLLAAVAAARQGDWAALQREMEAAQKVGGQALGWGLGMGP